MKNISKTIYLTVFLLVVSFPISAAEKVDLLKIDWSFKGLFGKFDRGSLQRGYQVYTEVCSSCHGLRYVPLRTISDEGGPGLPKNQMKAYAKTFPVNDEGANPKLLDPETGEYIPANKHWRNHFETNFGKVKRYERALEEFETPLEPEGIKHYSDKIKKAKRPDFMAMAVSGAGKYKSSETSESVKIQEARVYESIQELRGLEK